MRHVTNEAMMTERKEFVAAFKRSRHPARADQKCRAPPLNNAKILPLRPERKIAEQAHDDPSSQRQIRQSARASWTQRQLAGQQQILKHVFGIHAFVDDVVPKSKDRHDENRGDEA
jgi:hypothetical protein